MLFSCFFNQKFGAADGAFTINWFVPGSEGAIWKTIAAVKNFTPFGGTFDNFSAAAVFGAWQADFFTIAV